MLRALLLFLLMLSGCVLYPERRSMLAPLPPTPLLHLEDSRAVQVGVSRLARLTPVNTTDSGSGVRAPLDQYGITPMVRVHHRVAVGGSIHGASATGATTHSEKNSSLFADPRPTAGVTAAAHVTIFEKGPAALDGALQLSLDGMPRVTAGSIASVPTRDLLLIPGVMVSLVPRLTGWWGSAFVSATLHSNADIGAGEWEYTGPSVDPIGTGGASTFLAHVGIGYAKTFPFGLGLSVQAVFPLGARLNFGPMLSMGLHWAFIEPEARPAPPLSPPPEPVNQKPML